MRKPAIMTLIILALPLFAQTSSGSSFQAGAIFLTIFPGARPNGMGTVFTAIADDALATYYNPAGLAFLEGTDISLMHANWLTGLYPDMYYEFAGVSHPISAWGGVMGWSFTYLTTGETVATDPYGNEIARFSNFDFCPLVCYATKLRKDLGIGVAAKFIYSYLCPGWIVRKLDPGMKGGGYGMSWAIDLSTLYKTPAKGVQLGASLQNLGPPITFVEGGDKDPLPRMLRLGAAYKVLDSELIALTLATEFTKVLVGVTAKLKDEWDDTWKGAGVECTYHQLLSGRVGYFSDVAGHRSGLTFGGGVQLKSLTFDIGVDSEIYDFETDNYRLSLSYSF